MKLRTYKYLIKEGFSNSMRNSMMFLASTVTVMASLVILGVFILISENVSSVGKKIESNLTIQVYMGLEVSDERIAKIGEELRGINAGKVDFVSKQEAFRTMKKMDMMKGHENLLEGYDENNNFLPSSYIITLNDPREAQRTISMIKNIKDIKSDDIKYHKEVIEKVIGVMNIVRIVSFIVLVLLTATAILIIANTVKLTVFARRREIGIMKYIGATDFFIRLPFLVESLLIGTVASIFGILLVYYGYGAIVEYFTARNIMGGTGNDSFVPIENLSGRLFILYLFIGAGMGCIGSAISIKKYLKV